MTIDDEDIWNSAQVQRMHEAEQLQVKQKHEQKMAQIEADKQTDLMKLRIERATDRRETVQYALWSILVVVILALIIAPIYLTYSERRANDQELAKQCIAAGKHWTGGNVDDPAECV